MDKLIRWHEPRFGEEEKKLVSEVLDTGYPSEGPKTKELEEKIKEYLGVKYVVLTTSGTIALFLAVKADQIIRNLQNFEVIVPDFTMMGTINAVKLANAKPISVDVEMDRLGIDVNIIEKKITDKTKIIIPVHIHGRLCDINSLNRLAEKHNLTIIEDACGCLGSKYEDKYLGTYGKMGCFSLQSNKIISCGQGGVVVTNDVEYYEVLRRIRDQGRVNNSEKEYLIEGYNFKFNDISAAIMLGQFKLLEQRKQLALNQHSQYKKELAEIKQIRFPETYLEKGEIPFRIDIIVKNRKELIEYLKSHNIQALECWPSIHRTKSCLNQGNDSEFPNSSYISDNVLWIPNGPAVNEQDIFYVCNKIKEFYRN